MRGAVRSTMGKLVAGLLMLATLLAFAMPGHAVAFSSHQSRTVQQPDQAVLHDAGHEHGSRQAPCEDDGGHDGLHDGGACCSVAQCVTMHGGLPASGVILFLPPLGKAARNPALATPEGIGRDPALRPPL